MRLSPIIKPAANNVPRCSVYSSRCSTFFIFDRLMEYKIHQNTIAPMTSGMLIAGGR